MKKNLIIVVLALTSIASGAYGYFQKVRADESEMRAIENEKLAREMKTQADDQRRLAEQQTQIAEMNAQQAMIQRAIVEDLLQKKKGTK